MNKKLLVDVRPFEISRQKIDESIKENDGRLIVKGVLQRAESKNQNGRVYPREVLLKEVSKYLEEQVSERRALGELDHPESSVVNLNNASHNVIEMHWDGDDLLGTVEVLSTPSGNILKELFKYYAPNFLNKSKWFIKKKHMIEVNELYKRYNG